MTMRGKVILITGATSGIGKQTAIELAKKGAKIVFTTRDIKRGEEAKADIVKASGSNDVEFFFCDLASLESVRKFCTKFRAKYEVLNVLLNNAGVWDYRRRESKDGIENMFATNFLAPFLISSLLLDVLKKSAPSRIVNVTSGLHIGTIRFDDIEFRKGFSGFKAYRQSKLALTLYTKLLAKKLEGSGVTVNCVQPGMVATNLGRDATRFQKWMFMKLGKSIEEGAQTSIYAASSPEVEKVSGECFQDCSVKRTSESSYDMEMAQKLWDVAAKYVKL